jgi:citrate synthase
MNQDILGTMKRKRYLTATEATALLGINTGTLYSYVSRGLVRSEGVEGDSRQRRYPAEDVYRLKARKEQRRNPTKVAQDAIHWGVPILESALTLITDNNLYYRGYSALELAATRSIEEAAALFWLDDFARAESLFNIPQSFEELIDASRADLPYVPRLIQVLARAGIEDLDAYWLSPDRVAQTGARLLRLAACVLAEKPSAHKPVARLLNECWCPAQDATRVLDAVLILCGDHELNASSFAARVAASAEAQPYAVVIAGLAAIQGFKHGGNTERVEALLREMERPTPALIAERIRRGERIPGFGHRLYPDGDPRATVLLGMLKEQFSASPALKQVDDLIRSVQETIDLYPNIDLALVALARALNLPSGAPLALFALGRTVGWIGHAIEQYQRGELIRPRATYVGRPPCPER